MSRPHRLLLADYPGRPGEGSLHTVFRPLEALGVEIVASTSPEATRAALSEGRFDALVLDAGSLAEVLRASAYAPDSAPILIVADPRDPIPAVIAGRSLRRSTWDLVHRDASAEELLLRIERLAEQSGTLADLERARYHAAHDDLTGLLRPLRFGERLREHFSAAQRHRLEFALVLLDLDRFGQVNKEFDHMVGDELIARVGNVIRMSLREEDVGARIGGDEFAMLLPYTQRVDAARVVTRLAGRVRALSGPPPHPTAAHGDASPTIAVSASLGFETFNGSDLSTPEEMRGRAERALRVAKVRGGDCSVYFRNLGDDELAASRTSLKTSQLAPQQAQRTLPAFPAPRRASGDE